jgi:hypothetical protein
LPPARPVQFGHVPTTGERGLERVDPRTFTTDLQHVLEVAGRVFSSFWISDHVMSGANTGSSAGPSSAGWLPATRT